MRVNMHTHSVYCDGKDTPEEMIGTAIQKGFSILGFSGHGYSPYDTCSMNEANTARYIEKINALKERYRNEITIYLGIEQDSTCRIPSKDPYDFVIGSVHFLEKDGKYRPIDFSRDELIAILEEWYEGDFLHLAQDYYQEVARQGQFEEVDIIGHLDLLTKYNEKGDLYDINSKAYKDAAYAAMEKLAKADKIFEMNTGAISRGYRSSPYMGADMLKQLRSLGGKLTIQSDGHFADAVACAFDLCEDIAKSCGFEEIWVFDGEKFVAEKF